MALIAVSVEAHVARIFFDMGPTESSREDERHIAAMIERVFVETEEAEARSAVSPLRTR